MRRWSRRGDDPGQFRLDWDATKIATGERTPPNLTAEAEEQANSPPVLEPVETDLWQRLPWDFRLTFPRPTAQALEAGILYPEDAEPDNIRAIHEEHAIELSMVLQELDEVLECRRRGMDPKTGKAPSTPAARERLQKLFATEPARLERWWQNLMDTYETAFGAVAADAFSKAVRARHAGIMVEAEETATRAARACELDTELRPDPIAGKEASAPDPIRSTEDSEAPSGNPGPAVTARPKRNRKGHDDSMPVSQPLPAAIAGKFGRDKEGPIRHSPKQVKTLTENLAELLIELYGGLHEIESWLASPQCSDPARLYHEKDRLLERVAANLTRYAEDFGQDAAHRLKTYAQAEMIRRSGSAEPLPAGSNALPADQAILPGASRSHKARRIAAVLPVPVPLKSAVADGRFGLEENGKPVRPGPHEVREITRQHAGKLIDLLDSLASAPAHGKEALQADFDKGIAAYAKDFGAGAAKQLEAYVRRQAGLDVGSRQER